MRIPPIILQLGEVIFGLYEARRDGGLLMFADLSTPKRLSTRASVVGKS